MRHHVFLISCVTVGIAVLLLLVLYVDLMRVRESHIEYISKQKLNYYLVEEENSISVIIYAKERDTLIKSVTTYYLQDEVVTKVLLSRYYQNKWNAIQAFFEHTLPVKDKRVHDNVLMGDITDDKNTQMTKQEVLDSYQK